jgi:hypothetical protein
VVYRRCCELSSLFQVSFPAFPDLTTWNSGTPGFADLVLFDVLDLSICAGSPSLGSAVGFHMARNSYNIAEKTRLDDKQTYQLQSAFSVRETLKLQKGRLVSLLNVLFSKLVQPIILGLEGVEGLCTQWQHMATYPRLL